MQDKEYPVLLMMKDLRAQGWLLDPTAIEDHVPEEEPRRFALKGVVQRKTYLRCLLSLPDMFRAGLCRLPRGRPEKFYHYVLAVKDKRDVDVTLSLKDVHKTLKDLDVQLFKGSAIGNLAALELDYDDEALLALGDEDDREDGADGTVGAEGDQGVQEEMPPPPRPPDMPRDAAPEVADAGSGSSGSSPSSSGSDEGEEEPGQKRRNKGRKPVVVDGHTIRYETFAGDEKNAPFRRYVCECLLSSSTHRGAAPCKKNERLDR